MAVIFPGQGTQTPGMAASWRDHEAWLVVERAEAALGESLAPLVLVEPADTLRRTREAQLAVLLTSLVAWAAVQERLVETPVAFAGHSLGQLTALVAAGALGLEDGVRFAARRAEVTQAAADARPGRMAALLGADLDQAQRLCDAAPDACWIANDNAPGQVVIAGTPPGIDAATARARDVGVRRVTSLNVGGAFHTPLMAAAADQLTHEVASLALVTPTAPIVSNHDATPYRDAEGWRDRLCTHITMPVRWRTTQTVLTDLGAERFLEVGHGSMLAALAKRTVPDVPVRGVARPDDLPALTEV